MKYDYRSIDFLVLLPCPMKAAFGKEATRLAIQFREETGEPINFLPVSAMDPELIRDLMSITDPEDFPAVMMVPGLGFPYTAEFKQRFRDNGCFESILPEENPTFQRAGLYDPKHCYDIVGICPIAFFYDRTYHPELTPPTGWKALLTDPQYHRTVGMPGRETSGFQDFPIMAAYHFMGEESVLALAKTARSCMLPAEMVRMAGNRYIHFYNNERFQERFDMQTPSEVRKAALGTDNPQQYPIAENKRIKAYKAKFAA